jgi:hypothetical protein
VSARLADLVLATLRLRPEEDRRDLPARWSEPGVAAAAPAIEAWAAWEQGEEWLLRRLADSQALSRTPGTLVESLRRAAREATKAGMAVDAATAEVLPLLATAGVPCVLLKGPARRAAAAMYPLADARRTSDVDLLIPAASAELAFRTLGAAGYTPLDTIHPARAPAAGNGLWGPSKHHLRALARPGQAAVELHVSTSWELPPDAAWQRNAVGASEVSWQGGTVRVPPATELLWHGLTHAKPSDPTAWTLRYWLDAAAILAASDVDWNAIAVRLTTAELPDPVRARMWLSAAAQLAGVALPPSVAPSRRFPLARLVGWRLAVFARSEDTAWRRKLLDEATRAELAVGPAPLVAGRSWPIHVRRRAASMLARAQYRAWRALRS